MIANALAASLAAFTQGLDVDFMRAALVSFQVPASQTPLSLCWD